MWRLLGKVRKQHVKEIDINTSFQSIPSNLAYNDYCSKMKRSFISIKISEYLSIPKEIGDFLFYQSMANTSFMNYQNESDPRFIIYLAELMLQWNEQELDIPSKIKNAPLRADIQNVMLKVYEINKNNIFCQSHCCMNHNPFSGSQDHSRWEIYRDVIFAATQGQFLLISKEEISKYKNGVVFCEGVIKNRADIPLCRNKARETLEKQGINQKMLMNWLLVLSEAITNTIKHAEEGKMFLIDDSDNNEIRFVIEDRGSGFALQDLPNMTLLAGYSTKKSLGQGFTLMMKIAKQVILNTSSEGSTLILIFEYSKEKSNRLNATG